MMEDKYKFFDIKSYNLTVLSKYFLNKVKLNDIEKIQNPPVNIEAPKLDII